MLRRVDATSVTVWVALKAEQTITLRVLASDRTTVVMEGTSKTIPIGKHLHMVAVTARTSGSTTLVPDVLYHYNLIFGAGVDLGTPLILSAAGGEDGLRRIAYALGSDPSLPTFSLPPSKLTDLRLIHGSCRKPHGPGLDALRTLDVLLRTTANDPIQRPHQLFLTGDQIYADDVADQLLFLLTDAGDALLNPDDDPGSAEKLPGFDGASATHPRDLKPGQRQKVTAEKAGFTSSEARSHLLGLGEFLAMYLFVWSDVLWPSSLPSYDQVFPGQRALLDFDPTEPGPQPVHPDFARFSEQSTRVESFRNSLARVRRALANVPTYMIIDDHEITDDWYVHRAWAERVFGKPLGKRVIQNGLAAYTLFQAWGNTPEQFEVGAPSSKADLFTSISEWVKSGFSETLPYLRQISDLLPVPPDTADPLAPDLALDQAGKVRFYFNVGWSTHQVVALDTRTWRSFPNTNRLQAILFTDAGRQEQLGTLPPPIAGGVTLVAIAGPTTAVPFVESVFSFVFESLRFIGKMLKYFVRPDNVSEGVSYALDGRLEGLSLDPFNYEETLHALLARQPAGSSERKERLVLMAGDVHHGYANWLRYWAAKPSEQDATRTDAVIATLTSSPLQNATTAASIDLSNLLHHVGFELLSRTVVPDEVQRLSFRIRPTDSIGADQSRLNVGTATILGLAPGSLKADIERRRKIAIVENTADAVKYYSSAEVTRAPDAISRSIFIQSSDERATPDNIKPVNALPDERVERLQALLDASSNHALAYTDTSAPGKQVVGRNHLAVVRFQGFDPNDPEADKALTQEHWWWAEEPAQLFKDDTPQNEILAAPLSKFRVPLAVFPPPTIGVLK